MTKNTLYAAVALVTVMSSCAKKESAYVVDNGQVEINLNSGIYAKAVYDGDVAVADLQFLRADAPATTSDFTGKTAITGSRAVGGVITFGDAQYFEETNNAYFASYFPAGAFSANVVTWTIDAKTDIMTAATIDAGTKAAPSASASLTYKHKLSQIEVICKSASNDAATRWGKINSIKLKDTPTTMTYAYNGLAVTNGSALATIALVQPDYITDFAAIDVTTNTSNTTNAAGMFAPSTTQSFVLIIDTEKRGEKEVTIDLGTSNKLTEGKRHKITLTFNAELSVGSVIEEWSDGTTGTGEVN